MGCSNSTALTGITYDCTDIPIGGLKEVYVAHKADIVSITQGATDEVTAVVFGTVSDCKKIEFNNKDTFTSFTDVKSVDASGTTNCVPTVVIEFPKMTAAKRKELEVLSGVGLELVVFVKTAADTYHMCGYEYGMYGSEVNGQSGAGRTDKNVFQFTLVGEEDSLALSMDATGWDDVITSNIV